jgi:hypothetical protein
MPLPSSGSREEIHTRLIAMRAWRRADGLFDVEAHLVDTKSFDFQRVGQAKPIPAGQPLHDLWLRIVLDADRKVHDIVAVSDVTPFAICKEATATLTRLVGETVGPGWSRLVRERLRGKASCTHLAELLLPLATTALQGIRGVRPAAERFTPEDKARQIDSCYAYDASREVVATLWPQFARRGEE